MRTRNVRIRQALRYLRRIPNSYAYQVPWSVVERWNQSRLPRRTDTWRRVDRSL